MSNIVGIAGYATFNGITFINSESSKVVKAMRDNKGNIIVKDLKFFCRILRLYETRIGRLILKVPVLNDALKTLIFLGFSFFSVLFDMIKSLFIKKEWSVKKLTIILFLLISIYLYFFFNSYLAYLPLIPILFFLKNAVINTLKYHGAEHKVINMYENMGDTSNITIQTVKKYSKIHDRCGTNLLFLILPLALLFSFFIEIFMSSSFYGESMEYLGYILLLIIGMKLLKQFQKPLYKKFLKPGRFLQKYITTKEPDEEQIEVALTALKNVLT